MTANNALVEASKLRVHIGYVRNALKRAPADDKTYVVRLRPGACVMFCHSGLNGVVATYVASRLPRKEAERRAREMAKWGPDEGEAFPYVAALRQDLERLLNQLSEVENAKDN